MTPELQLLQLHGCQSVALRCPDLQPACHTRAVCCELLQHSSRAHDDAVTQGYTGQKGKAVLDVRHKVCWQVCLKSESRQNSLLSAQFVGTYRKLACK